MTRPCLIDRAEAMFLLVGAMYITFIVAVAI